MLSQGLHMYPQGKNEGHPYQFVMSFEHKIIIGKVQNSFEFEDSSISKTMKNQNQNSLKHHKLMHSICDYLDVSDVSYIFGHFMKANKFNKMYSRVETT